MLCVFLALAALSAQASRATSDRYLGVGRASPVRVNGQTLWEYAADQALASASPTEVLTGLLVIEAGRPGEVVTAGRLARPRQTVRTASKRPTAMPWWTVWKARSA